MTVEKVDVDQEKSRIERNGNLRLSSDQKRKERIVIV